MAASIDPDGKNGGPLLQTLVTNRSFFYGKLTYTTMPEQLQARGISWKVYTSPDQSILNGTFFRQRALVFQEFPGPDVAALQERIRPAVSRSTSWRTRSSGNLPQVSWIITSVIDSDHPPSPSLFGENTLSAIITALTANRAVGQDSALRDLRREWRILRPRSARDSPPGTPGEYITAPAVPDPSVVGNPAINGPHRSGLSRAHAGHFALQPRRVDLL